MAIMYACLRCTDDKNKKYCQPVHVIFKHKRDKQPIKPRHLNDFDKNEKYYVYWRSCGSNCKIKSGCCSMYSAYIQSKKKYFIH